MSEKVQVFVMLVDDFGKEMAVSGPHEVKNGDIIVANAREIIEMVNELMNDGDIKIVNEFDMHSSRHTKQ